MSQAAETPCAKTIAVPLLATANVKKGRHGDDEVRRLVADHITKALSSYYGDAGGPVTVGGVSARPDEASPAAVAAFIRVAAFQKDDLGHASYKDFESLARHYSDDPEMMGYVARWAASARPGDYLAVDTHTIIFAAATGSALAKVTKTVLEFRPVI